MRKSYRRSRSRGPIYGILALCIVWTTVLNNLIVRQTKDLQQSDNLIQRNSRGNVCVCLADNRFSERDLSLANIKTLSDLRAYVDQDSHPTNEWGYWRQTAVINKAYALRRGYDVIMSDLVTYVSVYNDTRGAVWLKPAFMLDMQYKRPDCHWFAMMDSDAYFWMANHSVALADWFSTKSLHEATPRYHQYEEERRRRHGYYDWNDVDAFLLIGLNGVFSEPYEGYPNIYWGKTDDFMCAGVYFIRNCQRSKQFLHDWVYGPKDVSAEERSAIDHYAHHFPFEQRILNLVLFPRYKDYIHIHSYRDFASKEGTMIRHVWSQFGSSRSSLIYHDRTNLGL